MIINAQLQHKATQISPDRCQVDEVVHLDYGEFEYLKNCTLDDFDFIKDALDKLPVTNDNTRHCILALNESGDDGILIDPQGYSYPRYSAYIPNAKLMFSMEQYPSFRIFINDMMHTVEEVTQLALNSQENGEFTTDLEEIEESFCPNVLDKYLLVDMLGERPEFKFAAHENGELKLRLSEDYISEGICEDETSGICL